MQLDGDCYIETNLGSSLGSRVNLECYWSLAGMELCYFAGTGRSEQIHPLLHLQIDFGWIVQ